jgi:hypothetical protein
MFGHGLMIPMQCLENNHYFNVTALQQNGDDGLQVNEKIDSVITTSFSTIDFLFPLHPGFCTELALASISGLGSPTGSFTREAMW